MKRFIIARNGGSWLAVVCLSLFGVTAPAQLNTWTGASGNWEDPQWSLGVMPGPGQTVLFTPAGDNTLRIGAHTTANFPQSLQLFSLTVQSLPGSANTLLLDHAGLATALAPRDL